MPMKQFLLIDSNTDWSQIISIYKTHRWINNNMDNIEDEGILMQYFLG